VVGDKEAESNAVNVRTRGKDKTETVPLESFVERIGTLIAEKKPNLD
jgi:threonyl-tRNA synthetase